MLHSLRNIKRSINLTIAVVDGNVYPETKFIENLMSSCELEQSKHLRIASLQLKKHANTLLFIYTRVSHQIGFVCTQLKI